MAPLGHFMTPFLNPTRTIVMNLNHLLGLLACAAHAAVPGGARTLDELTTEAQVSFQGRSPPCAVVRLLQTQADW